MEQSYTEGLVAPAGYRLLEGNPTPEEFVRLREAAGMGPRSIEAAEKGLPNSLYAVHVRDDEDRAVAVGRVVGDRGTVFQISDVAVAEAHQGNGLGTVMMEAIMTYITDVAPETAYVNLLADVDGFYDRWDFEYSAPASRAMVWQP